MDAVDACEVSITTGSRHEAVTVADDLLDARLAACVQITGPIESRYWWQGERQQATEWRCSVKTRAALVDGVIERVRAVHSYATPEIVAVPIVAGDRAYLDWLAAEASGGGRP